MAVIRGGFFVERELFLSEAFKALKLSGVRILLYVLDSRIQESKKQAKTKKGTSRKPRFVNLDKLYIPYDIVHEKTGLSLRAISAGIDDILAKGFIEIKYHGGATKHDMSIYSWRDNWLFWTKGAEFFKRPTRSKRGYQDPARRRAKNVMK